MVDSEFVMAASASCFKHYRNAVKTVGLWKSERDVFTRFFNRQDRILDMGCGAGRISYGLVEMGYKDVVGVDFSPEMIESAKSINRDHDEHVSFVEGDCLDLELETESFDSAVFSFSGLMQIPLFHRRVQALSELIRVIKPGGVVIFTTQDRDADPQYYDFWRNEALAWLKANQDPRLNEFGDRLFNEEDGAQTFIHIPDINEVMQMINAVKAHLIETFLRSYRFKESEAVKAFSSNCRFWVIRKPHQSQDLTEEILEDAPY